MTLSLSFCFLTSEGEKSNFYQDLEMVLDWGDSPDFNQEKRESEREWRKKNENDALALILVLFCDLVRIQTWNLYSRNVVLYSVELRSLLQGDLISFARAKILLFYFSLQVLLFFYENLNFVPSNKSTNNFKNYSISALIPRSSNAVHIASNFSYSPRFTWHFPL